MMIINVKEQITDKKIDISRMTNVLVGVIQKLNYCHQNQQVFCRGMPIFKIMGVPSFSMAFRPLSKVPKKFFNFMHFWWFAAPKTILGNLESRKYWKLWYFLDI